MTMGYLDTNILIGFFKGEPGIREALERFDSLKVPAVAHAEFMAGLPHESQRKATDEAIDILFDLVQTDRTICQEAARLRRETRLKLIDALILATARAGNGVLITRDRDFEGIGDGVYIPAE